MILQMHLAGPSSPAPIEQFMVYGVSFELAIIQWTVSQITYTPEIYRVIYRQITEDSTNPNQTSELVIGTTNLSALNTVYSEVIKNLQPNSRYTYQILSSNTRYSIVTPAASFTTSNSGNSIATYIWMVVTVTLFHLYHYHTCLKANNT